MSTKKITALTELSAAPAATDMIPIVDVSDTTDASSGSTKKITATNVGKGIGIGAGNTTSEPIKINTANGKVGIGNTSPEGKVHIMSGGVSVAPNTSADELVLENAGDCGISILTNDASLASVYLGNTSDNVGAAIEWDYDGETNGIFKVGTQKADAQLVLMSGDEEEVVRINSIGNVGINCTDPVVQPRGHLEVRGQTGSNSPGVLTLSTAHATIADGDRLGVINFMASKEASGTDALLAGASIEAVATDAFATDNNSTSLKFSTGASETATEKMRITSAGNVLIGGTATPTSSVGNLCLFNGTIPAASVANGVVLYAQDVSTSELKVRDEAGNVSTLSPHNFDLLGERSEDMAWSYSSKNVFVGKEIAVDMTKVIRALEKLTGEEYIKIRDIDDSEKLDWATEEEKYEAEQKKEIDAYNERKAKSDAHPTNSSTKAEIKTFLDAEGISYEDAPKAELFEKVPEKPEFTESEPAAYTKKPKPKWLK